MNDNDRTRRYRADLTNMERNTLFGITLLKEKPYICYLINQQDVFIELTKR